MKKFIFALFLMTAAYSVEHCAAITAKFITSDNKGYLAFSDGSFFRVTTFVKRWRGPLEWLSGEELYVPENYLCSLKDWGIGDEFELLPKYGYSRVDESYASNESDIKLSSHILVNLRTEKILFAVPLHPGDLMSQIYSDGHANGYSKGYSEGYSSGYDSGKAFSQLPKEN